MQPDNKEYNYLLEKFGVDKVKGRFLFILNAAESFKNKTCKAIGVPEDSFKVSAAVIEDLVLDYFADIARMKNFHSIEKSQPQKVAAYTAYWVFRRKPMQIINDPSDDLLKEYANIKYLNEAFACSVLINMSFDTRDPIANVDLKSYNQFYENLMYYMIFRAVNPQTLEIILNALSCNPIYNIVTESRCHLKNT